MSELIMLVGEPGSGKSTWTEAMPFKHNYVVISMDNIIESMGAPEGLSYKDAFDKYSSVAARKMKEELKIAFKNNMNVVWDQTNLTVKSRRKKLNMVPDGYSKTAVIFEIGSEELERRRVLREGETGKIVPLFVMRQMHQSYARPTKAEGFDHIKIVTS